MIQLYTNALSPFAQPVELQLELKDIEFESIAPKREFLIDEEFLRLNPMRKIPVLVVDGVAIGESLAIGELIEELHPQPPLLPSDPLERARVRMLTNLVAHYLATPGVKMNANRREGGGEAIEADAKALIARGLAAIDELISTGPYAVGDTRTLADCWLVPALFFVNSTLDALGFERVPEPGPNTASYYDAVRQDADFAASISRTEAVLREWAG